MISKIKSIFSRIDIGQFRHILATYWRKLIVISVSLLGLALFVGAEYGLGNMIVNGSYLLAIGAFISATVLIVTIAYPFWGYIIWFFLSCYLTLFLYLLPAMFSFDLIMLSLLTFVLISRALFRKKPINKLSIEEVFLILYFVYAYIIRSEFDTSHIVAELKVLVISPLFFYFIAKSIITEKKHIYWLMIVIIVTGFSWALMGIYEQITQKMWLAAALGGDRGLYAGIRSAGPAGFYYLYGNMLILTILLCLHVFKWMQKFYSKLIIVIVCLIAAVGLYYGYSRAPYIAFVLSFIIMLFLVKYTRVMYVTPLVMLIFVAAFIIVPTINSNKVLTNRFSTPVDARLATNISSMNMFKANYLFGVGTGKYGDNVAKYVKRGHLVKVNPISGIRNDYSTSHSEYFLKLCELGVVGFVLYFGMYLLFLYRMIKIRAKLSMKDVAGHDLASLAFAFTIAVLFTMITDQFAINQFMYAIVFLVFAMVKKAELYAVNDAIESTGLSTV